MALYRKEGFRKVTYPRPPKSGAWALPLIAGLLLFFLTVFGLVAICVEPAPAQEPRTTVTVRIADFGKGMTPVLPQFRNDPTAIVWSENMLSTQPGGRQTRFGLTGFGDAITATDSAVRSLGVFFPKSDSGSIIYAAGGKWFGNVAGIPRHVNSAGFDWNDYLTAGTQIRPFPGADSVGYAGDSLVGFGSFFTRDIQPGDTIELGGSREVEYVKSDSKLYVINAFSGADTVSAWTITRSFPTGGYKPFLTASGDYLYTGTVVSPPQVVYVKDDTLRIRHMGIVDSFYIDSIYLKYPPSAAAWDSASIYGGRRSWDTTATGDEYRKEFQLVSRRKPGRWLQDQWFESINRNPEAYYCRVGYDDKAAFYPIGGNTDTSIYLMAWAVDTLLSSNDWNDSLYFGAGRDFNDQVSAADVVGKWGYIYAAAGFHRTVVGDGNTGEVAIRGRGAMFYTVDGSFPIDSTEMYKGMHFIHLTGNDVTFPSYIDQNSTRLKEYTTYRQVGNPIDTATLPVGDTIRNERFVWRCESNTGRFPGKNPYRSTFEEAQADCGFQTDIVQYIEYILTTDRTDRLTKESEAIGNAYYPISYMSHSGDTVFFVTAVGTDLTDASEVTTSKWEIVRVGLPYWSGMTEWNTPPQLVAWGDTASPSLLSFSGVNDPWNWSANNDVLVGDNPSDPLKTVYGDDDQLTCFKASSMVGFDGSRFTELAQSIGIVGPGAVVGLNKELYWVYIDGVYRKSRRDFNGYTIEKISMALDPVFNAWSATVFGADVVPEKLVPAYRENIKLVHNQRDQHLYLFGTFTSGSTNNGVLVYSLDRQIWDGYFDIAATDAIWATVRDTSRILIGSPDSATIYALDYVYSDLGTGINTDLKSAKFFLTDNEWPVKSRLGKVWFNSRSTSGGLDSAYVIMIGENASDTFDLSFAVAPGDIGTVLYAPSDNVSRYWQWQIKSYGSSSATIFQPHELVMDFIVLTREQ